MPDSVNIIEKMLWQEHSKAQRDRIIEYIGNAPERLEALVHLFINGGMRITQRAAWPLGEIGVNSPEKIKPYLGLLIDNLETAKHDAVIRNTIRLFQEVEVPEAYQGKMYEICFQFLISMKSAIAIKAFSMTVLANISSKFPELKEELIAVIEDQYPHGSPGFKGRARTVLKQLKA